MTEGLRFQSLASRPTKHDEAHMPCGGVKASGYGRFGGKAAAKEFPELRGMTIQTSRQHYPF
ncbi:MAG: hypothetical protein WCA76_14870 [Candidatus Sulfotelmatobacter sp.]|jgi:acyl-CoA reductase-like NAD-dependent aldehyde dehydrogenase